MFYQKMTRQRAIHAIWKAAMMGRRHFPGIVTTSSSIRQRLRRLPRKVLIEQAMKTPGLWYETGKPPLPHVSVTFRSPPCAVVPERKLLVVTEGSRSVLDGAIVPSREGAPTNEVVPEGEPQWMAWMAFEVRAEK
jgi:hypothetical protein